MCKDQRSEMTQLGCWEYAPKERSPEYFHTYAAVARAMQRAMRVWIRKWFSDHPEILSEPAVAYPILFYISTDPCRAKAANYFTYDVQETEMLQQGFRSATANLATSLLALQTTHLPWKIRERYFPYRSKEIAKHITENFRAELYCMFHVETLLMDHLLKFALINIPKLGLDRAYTIVTATFHIQLKRFSTQLDLSTRTEQLLCVATESLSEELKKGSANRSRPAGIERSSA